MNLQRFNTNNHLFWITIAIIGKVFIILLLQLNLDLWGKETPFLYGGDGPMYVKVAENIRNFGVYALYGDNLNNLEPYTGRMPGYEPLIIFFRLFSSITGTLYCLIFVQVILAAISTYYLAKTAFIVFKKESLFYITFFTYLINTYVTIFDISILTESFAISIFIISLYLLIKPQSTLIHYLIAGFFLGWGIFLRQYFVIVFGVFILFIIYKEFKTNKKSFYRNSLLKIIAFSSFFVLADGAWIIRNYQVKKKFIPLVDDLYAGYKFPERQKAIINLVHSWGGDIIWWNPKAEIALFINNEATNKTTKSYNSLKELPSYIYTSDYTVDSIKKLQQTYALLESNAGFLNEDLIKKENWIIQSCSNYKESFAKEKPFYYHLISRLRLLPKFIFHSGTYNLSSKSFSEQTILGKSFKIFYTLFYWLILVGGVSSVIYLYLKKEIYIQIALVIIVALYTIILCPLILKRIEYRYFVLSYPYLTILTSFFLYKIKEIAMNFSLFANRKESSNSVLG